MAYQEQPDTEISNMSGLHNDIGEKSGFQTTGYIFKGNTPMGENAKFNFMPPGMDIDNQAIYEPIDLPLEKVVEESYPGDGWEPKPRSVA
jgi:hypothetical protein